MHSPWELGQQSAILTPNDYITPYTNGVWWRRRVDSRGEWINRKTYIEMTLARISIAQAQYGGMQNQTETILHIEKRA